MYVSKYTIIEEQKMIHNIRIIYFVYTITEHHKSMFTCVREIDL